MIKTGLIPAAGMGIRAYPATNYIPKVMLEIAGKPIILRTIDIMRDKIGLEDIYVITGYMGDVIKGFLKDGRHLGVRIHYIDCEDPGMGLAKGIGLARGRIKGDFVTMLGDEVYINSNHQILKEFDIGAFSAACGIMKTDDFNMIAKNYTVELDGENIISLEEKPLDVSGGMLGCGTYIFKPEIFDAIERTAPSRRTGRVELTDAINNIAKKETKVCALFFKGIYHNINSVEDYNDANHIYRSTFFDEYKISVIIPSYNEEESIGSVVRDFVDKVDEVFVVDNSSCDGTREAASASGARVETVKLKGYGDTIRYGLDNARGDILIVAEADHSFRAKDLGKFLEYLKDSDMVVGTRTTRQMIEQGTNMKGLVRWGNVFVGKLVEALWWSQEPRFTDVGCTYRAVWKDTYLKIRDKLCGVGPELSPEMMIEVLRAHKRIIEIPVSYYRRLTGISKHSQDYLHLSRTAFKMLAMILRKRFNL